MRLLHGDDWHHRHRSHVKIDFGMHRRQGWGNPYYHFRDGPGLCVSDWVSIPMFDYHVYGVNQNKKETAGSSTLLCGWRCMVSLTTWPAAAPASFRAVMETYGTAMKSSMDSSCRSFLVSYASWSFFYAQHECLCRRIAQGVARINDCSHSLGVQPYLGIGATNRSRRRLISAPVLYLLGRRSRSLWLNAGGRSNYCNLLS